MSTLAHTLISVGAFCLGYGYATARANKYLAEVSVRLKRLNEILKQRNGAA